MILKRTFCAAVLHAGVSAAILAFAAGAAVADGDPPDPLDPGVIIADGGLLPSDPPVDPPVDPPGDPAGFDPLDDLIFGVDPICGDCDGEIDVIYVEDVPPGEEVPPGEDDGIVDDGIVDGGEAVPVDDDDYYPTSQCGGCESWHLTSDLGPVVGAFSGTNADEVVAGRPNICTTPELYVAWLCEWQGFERP